MQDQDFLELIQGVVEIVIFFVSFSGLTPMLMISCWLILCFAGSKSKESELLVSKLQKILEEPIENQETTIFRQLEDEVSDLLKSSIDIHGLSPNLSSSVPRLTVHFYRY